MKVKIIKAALPTYWYADKIGEIVKAKFKFVYGDWNYESKENEGWYFDRDDVQRIELKSLSKLQKKIINWAKEKDLIFPDNSKNQLLKTMSELGELSDALLKYDSEKIKDGIGDVLVTLIILAETQGLTLKECLNQAWNEIKDRKGETVNGTFIKS